MTAGGPNQDRHLQGLSPQSSRTLRFLPQYLLQEGFGIAVPTLLGLSVYQVTYPEWNRANSSLRITPLSLRRR